MSLRKTLILLVVLAALGAYLAFVEMPRGEQRAQEDRLTALTVERIQRVVLEKGEQLIELERLDGDAWQLLQPVKASADVAAVRSLLAAITDAKVQRTLADAGDPAAFGLVDDALVVRIEANDQAPQTFSVGKSAPVGSADYAQRRGESAVLLIEGGFRATIDRTTDELRDKRIFDFEDDDVRWIEIAKSTRQARLDRSDDGWTVAGEPTYAGDDTAIQTYLASLRSLRVASFVEQTPSDLAAFGLSEPRLTVRFGGSDEKVWEIAFGADKAGTEYHAVATPGGNVFTVHDWAYRNLDKGTRDLRDKALLALDTEQIHRVKIVRRDRDSVQLVRSDDSWRLDGVDSAVKSAEIEHYINDLATLAGYEIVADEPQDLGRFALDDPILRIEVLDQDNAPLGTVRVGRTVADDGIHHFNAISDRAPTVVLLRSYIFNRLDKSADDFIERPPSEEGANEPPSEDPHAGHNH